MVQLLLASYLEALKSLTKAILFSLKAPLINAFSEVRISFLTMNNSNNYHLISSIVLIFVLVQQEIKDR